MRAMWKTRRLWVLMSATCLVVLVATSLSALAAQGSRPKVPSSPSMTSHTVVRPVGPGTVPAQTWLQNGAWFQSLIYLYASGNAPIQSAAVATGASAGLSAAQVQRISAAVRAAWVRMMTADPAELGRVGVAPNLAGQSAVLTGLRNDLRAIAGTKYSALLTATSSAYRLTTDAIWLRAQGIQTGAVTNAQTTASFTYVYATSFSIPGKPNVTTASQPQLIGNSSNPPPFPAGYVALPDAYLKFANLGQDSSILPIYQPFYLPQGSATPLYTVDIATGSGRLVDLRVPIEDVGPWNEDDNWWDPTNTGTTIPASCPISTSLVSSHSLSNAQVDGICPGSSNWRRVYYYLLYKHGGTPFFQPSAYSPTGSYADTTAWPPLLPRYCPEASAASINNYGAPCVGSLAGYNANASAWMRGDTYDAPILNQSGIDLSPDVDARLGWKYPSSGFIQVNLSRLP